MHRDRKFRQETYSILEKAKDATFKLYNYKNYTFQTRRGLIASAYQNFKI